MAELDLQAEPTKWLKRLLKALDDRKTEIVRCDDYYRGKHNLAFAGKKFREAFGGLFGTFADNWCEVVVDAVEERLNIEGFRFGEAPEADKDAWAIWQRNELDADSQLVHTESLVTGYGYALVWADDDGKALITGESPSQCIVAHATGSRRRRAAGLKRWHDDDGHIYAVVYLPDGIYKYRTKTKASTDALSSVDEQLAAWETYQPKSDDSWPLPNPLDVVPLVPLYNKPRLIRPGTGESELARVIPLQDAINKLFTDMLVASEFGAFRQRWATGLDMEQDEAGNKVFPFRSGPGNVWAVEPGDDGAQETKFGEFSETSLENFVKAIEMGVQHLASQTRTPPHYLNASADRLSGESIKAAETGLVAKTRRKMRPYGEAWEDVMRLAFAVETTDDPRANAIDAEAIWADPESRTEAEHVDATLKKVPLKVPLEQLWEDLGYSPQQRARFKAMRAEELMDELLTQAALGPAPVEPVPPV